MQYINKKIILGDDEFSNYIEIDGIDYILEYLDPTNTKKSFSPNAFIFNLRNCQEENDVVIMKICSTPLQQCSNNPSIERFKREIRALQNIKDKQLNSHVIEIFTSGETVVDGKRFLYYTMERGTSDLLNYLKQNQIETPEKYRICADILKSIKNLHDIGIYHRDIKPNNFIMINDVWKIGDLGLVAFRDDDFSSIDTTQEKVGPRGFLSPEALNKWLSINRNAELTQIDNKSDVFQLAKVIGFILLGEILTGILDRDDFMDDYYDHSNLFEILCNALQYSKSRRYDINKFKNTFFETFKQEYAF